MYPDLEGKRTVITGGASGIGLATAHRFVDEGAKVVVFDFDTDALVEVERELPGLAGVVDVDVSSDSTVKSGFAAVDELLGGVDVLISNAGISVRSPIRETTYEQWKRVVDTNLGGMFLCSKEASVRMVQQGGGTILMTASTNGLEGHPFYADYNASKAGVILLAKTMALEFAPTIRVNAVCPGYVLTPMQKAEYTTEMLDATNEGIPFKRHAEPEEVAALFAFLASEQASYITGAAIPIDGGETAGLM
jgi:NAD(P)-dependent dehydrogenase (short-subunit alcohol dehydrogenase family)